MTIKSVNKKGSVISEEVVVFFIIVGVAAAMGIYVQRAIQARIRDSYRHMITTLREINKEVPREYEPYYTQTESQVGRKATETSFLGDKDVYTKTIDEATTINTKSEQLPPKRAD